MTTTSLFGAVSLGYVLVESRRLDAWRSFLVDGLGLHLAEEGPETRAFRLDAHARRIVVRRGDAEDVAALGIELRDRAALETVLARLERHGIETTRIEGEEAALRGVTSFVRLEGPKRLPLELFVDPLLGEEPLRMRTSGFVTGAGGLGHVAVTSRLPERTQRFWEEIFDARLSDRVSERLGGLMLDVTFLRLNPRHHSVAIAATRGLHLDPIRTRIQHLNLLAASLDDVSSARRRIRELGFEIAREIGQHPNDREISFYAVSPSGFEIELGCDALVVDEAGWQPAHYDAISLWGHAPGSGSTLHAVTANLGNLLRGLGSLRSPEYSPLRAAS